METSIDEGLETEGEAEEDPSQAFEAFQATRSGQRRHTLSEVTNQLVVMPGTGMILESTKLNPYSVTAHLRYQEIVAMLTSSGMSPFLIEQMPCGLGLLSSYRN